MEKIFREFTLLIIVVAIGQSVPLQAQRRKPISPPRPVQSTNRLHEMAQKSGGHFVLRYRPNRSTLYPNVEELAKRSDVVVVGRTLSHRSRLSEDGNQLHQDFLVRVQEVVKGSVTNGRSITISLPGGSYMFPDKTFVIVTPLGQQAPEDQKTYVFFLKLADAASRHALASETQGMFALANGKVRPSDLTKDDPIVTKYQEMGVVDFLKEVHKAIPRREQKTGK